MRLHLGSTHLHSMRLDASLSLSLSLGPSLGLGLSLGLSLGWLAGGATPYPLVT